MTSTLLLIFAAVALVAGGIYWVTKAKAEKEVTAAVLTASGVIAAALFSGVIAHQEAKRREIAEAHRLHKIEVYTQFTDLVVKSIAASKQKPSQDASGGAEQVSPATATGLQDELEAGFLEFSKKLLLWGSPDVIRTYEDFQAFGQDPRNATTANVEILLRVDDVFQSMRQDLDLENGGLGRGDLIKLFLKDAAELNRMLGR